MSQVARWITLIGGATLINAELNYAINGEANLDHQAQALRQHYRNNPQALQAIENALSDSKSLTPVFGAGIGAVIALLYLIDLFTTTNNPENQQSPNSWIEYFKSKGKRMLPPLGAALVVGTLFGAGEALSWTQMLNESFRTLNLPAHSFSFASFAEGTASTLTASLLTVAALPILDMSVDALSKTIKYLREMHYEFSLQQAKQLALSFTNIFHKQTAPDETDSREQEQLLTNSTTYQTLS
jgi:hypothetical protein